MADMAALRLIKKYSNRRLYDTQTSTHITLADVRQLVLDETPFQVVDAKTGEDLTRSILLQIIQEAEAESGEPIFSTQTLSSMIRCYGPWQGTLGRCLDQSVQMLLDIQKKNGNHSSQAWLDFMKTQTPLMSDLLVRYFEQSKQLYLSTQKMFGIFPGFPVSSNFDDKDKAHKK